MFKIIKKKKKELSIKKFFERRNKVLIKRTLGGFGDILMQRMMFEDFAKTGLDIHYTCPSQFIELVQDHKFLKEEPIELHKIDEEEFGIVYDITRICAYTESRELEKNTRHRSDIWANYCGVDLTKHEMHLTVDPECLSFCRDSAEKINPEKRPMVLLCTKSSAGALGIAKSLTNEQTRKIVEYVKSLGMVPITTDEKHQDIYSEMGVMQFTPITVKTWIALVSICDLVISVDTATFHMAGGLKKPLVGVFSFIDGKVYGKHYEFVLVQKHRDNGDWDCGPCFAFIRCPKESTSTRKPCITHLSFEEIKAGIDEAIRKWEIPINRAESLPHTH